jgi:hypothetical protein
METGKEHLGRTRQTPVLPVSGMRGMQRIVGGHVERIPSWYKVLSYYPDISSLVIEQVSVGHTIVA